MWPMRSRVRGRSRAPGRAAPGVVAVAIAFTGTLASTIRRRGGWGAGRHRMRRARSGRRDATAGASVIGRLRPRGTRMSRRSAWRRHGRCERWLTRRNAIGLLGIGAAGLLSGWSRSAMRSWPHHNPPGRGWVSDVSKAIIRTLLKDLPPRRSQVDRCCSTNTSLHTGDRGSVH
jgi:hypothetical protein